MLSQLVPGLSQSILRQVTYCRAKPYTDFTAIFKRFCKKTFSNRLCVVLKKVDTSQGLIPFFDVVSAVARFTRLAAQLGTVLGLTPEALRYHYLRWLGFGACLDQTIKHQQKSHAGARKILARLAKVEKGFMHAALRENQPSFSKIVLFSAGFRFKTNVGYSNILLHSFAHVVDRERGDRDCGQRLHLDSGLRICDGLG